MLEGCVSVQRGKDASTSILLLATALSPSPQGPVSHLPLLSPEDPPSQHGPPPPPQHKTCEGEWGVQSLELSLT